MIDITNPLDFSNKVPSLFVSNTDSLSETIQRFVPDSNIVKTLNTVNAGIMVNPIEQKVQPTMFVAGNNKKAKELAIKFLKDFGWEDIIDMGDLTGARAMEMMLRIWIRVFSQLNTQYFGFKV